jgi:hypothetical protein
MRKFLRTVLVGTTLTLVAGLFVVPPATAATPPRAPDAEKAVPDGAVEVFSGYTTDPRYIADPNLLAEAFQVGKSPTELGLEPNRQQMMPSTSEAEIQRAKDKGISYTAPSAQYDADNRQKIAADPPSYDYITKDECLAHKDQAGNPEGWVKNHFAFCTIGVLYAGARRHIVGPIWVPAGNIQIRVTNIGFGKKEPRPGSTTDRFARFEMFMDDFQGSGVFLGPRVDLEARMQCSGCQIGADSGKKVNMLEWARDPQTSFELVSPANEASEANGEQRATAVFKPIWNFSAEGLTMLPPRVNGDEGGMRFDSAWYLPRKQGSIFDRVVPSIAYSVSDKPVQMSAYHMRDAINFPESTVPRIDGKHIPGGSSNDTIRRLYADKSRRDKNRSVAVGVCEKEWPGYPELGQDCDEFPYASTYEGAARDQYEQGAVYGQFSVKPINAPDNQEAGSRLGVWYGDDRILDGDPFFVRILE